MLLPFKIPIKTKPGKAVKIVMMKKLNQPNFSTSIPADGPTITLPIAEKEERRAYWVAL